MAGTNGTDILIGVWDGASAFDIVGMQQDATTEETTESIDFSSKDARERAVEPGRYASSGTLDSVWMPTDAAYVSLQAAMRDGTKIQLQKTNNAVILETADVVVTSLSRTEPDQGPVIASMAYDVDGAWTPGP